MRNFVRFFLRSAKYLRYFLRSANGIIGIVKKCKFVCKHLHITDNSVFAEILGTLQVLTTLQVLEWSEECGVEWIVE